MHSKQMPQFHIYSEEKAKRREAMEKVTFKAAEIPLQTAKLCLEGLREIPKLLDGANPNVLSDMGVTALMFKAGLDGALLTNNPVRQRE